MSRQAPVRSAVLRARWVLPIDQPPIDGGWIEVAGGRIQRLGAAPAPSGARDLGDVALLPGLVNAHTHLELSALAGRVPPAASMVTWIRQLLAARAAGPAMGDAARSDAVARAAATMSETGTVIAGDVSNALADGVAMVTAGIGGVIFHELIGFATADPVGAVRDAWRRADRAAESCHAAAPACAIAMSVAAHAPYSVSPALFGAIARSRPGAPLTVHLAESPEEREFLRTGRGPFRALLEDLGAWNPAWSVPACDPVTYLERVGYLQPGVLAVHGVHLQEAEIERLAQAGAVLVTCPRSNEWVGAGMPPVSRFYAAGVPVAIGTDSLASAPSLNLFDELAELRRIAPDVSAACLLESATRVGADALGFGRSHGTIGPGKRAAFAAVDVPPDVADVEEYLVSGVPASRIHALTA